MASPNQDVEIQLATEADRPAWSEYLARHESGEFTHAWEFAEAIQTVFGARSIRLVARRGDAWVGLLPLVHQRSLIGGFLTSMPYLGYAGVLADDRQAAHALAVAALAHADRLGVDRLELRARREIDLPIPTWSAKLGFELALPANAEELWTALGSKLRSQVKRPRREGYQVRFARAGGYREFCPLLERRWHELGSPVLPRALFRELESVAADGLEYVFVTSGEQIAAAGLTITHRGRVEMGWAASAGEHNRFGVNMLLYWAAIERAIERGLDRFDFGRSNPESGHARFKRQWGAEENRLAWHVRVRTARGRSSESGGAQRGLAARCWSLLPAAVARRVGPAFAARIPL